MKKRLGYQNDSEDPPPRTMTRLFGNKEEPELVRTSLRVTVYVAEISVPNTLDLSFLLLLSFFRLGPVILLVISDVIAYQYYQHTTNYCYKSYTPPAM